MSREETFEKKKRREFLDKKMLYQSRLEIDDPQDTRSFCIRQSTIDKIDELSERLNISKSELLRQAVNLLLATIEGKNDFDDTINSLKIQRTIEIIKEAFNDSDM